MVTHVRKGPKRRRRFFRRHPMGLPSVLLVAVLAGVGFWYTLHAPERTGSPEHLAGFSAGEIPRGCLLPEASTVPEICRDEGDTGTLVTTPPAGLTRSCATSHNDYPVEVWADSQGNRWLHWKLPQITDQRHALGNHWVVAWAGGNQPVLRFTEAAEGWAPLPGSSSRATAIVLAGSIALGGSLHGGLQDVKAFPIGLQTDGSGVRLAASINGGAIIMEVPPDQPFELIKTREQLRFNQWTTELRCA
jgi:hypothetical protein